MTTRDNVHPITDADLEAHRDDAEFRMQNVPMRGVSYDLLGEMRKLPGVELNIGSKLSDKVELHEVPNVKYRYTVIDNRTVVVDPDTHTIVKVLN